MNRAAQKQSIRGLGVSQGNINIALGEIKDKVTENVYRQLVRKYGADVVLAATVSMVGTEVAGKCGE